MKGTQSSNIQFKGYDHMDALLLKEGYTRSIYDKIDYYSQHHSPYYANSILTCEDTEVIDPQAEATKGKLNKYKQVWRKIFDDYWMEDTQYFLILDWYYYTYANLKRSTPVFTFTDYKNASISNIHNWVNTSYHYQSVKNKLCLALQEAYSYGSQTSRIGIYNDYIDGRRYDFNDNPRFRIHLSQNGIDWYTYLVKTKWGNEEIWFYNNVAIASEGLYLTIIYKNGNNWSNPTESMMYIPYELGEENSISIGKPKLFGRDFGLNTHIMGGMNFFTIDKYLFILTKESKNSQQRIVINKVTPEGNITKTYTNYYYSINLHSNILCEKDGKVYLITSTQLQYVNTDWEPAIIKDNMCTIDVNGTFTIIHSEQHINYRYNNRWSNAPNKMDSMLGSNGMMASNVRPIYDKSTGYYYFYNDIGYTSKAFPKEGGNYYRVIIGKTRDFIHFEYNEAPPYRIIKDIVNDKNIAILMDSAYESQLSSDYAILPFRQDVKWIAEPETNIGTPDRFCFDNEKISYPRGIFGVSYNEASWDLGGDYSSYGFYISKFDLTASDKDFVYSLWKYNDQMRREYFISQTLVNQVNGLDYPGKDT